MKQSEGPRHLKVGVIGECIAVSYLERKGQIILSRNYRKKWGEIDIVSRETTGKVHFIEVKTVSYETKEALREAVARRTFRPEENVHERKLQRIERTIESWLGENNPEAEWVIDVLTVRIVPSEKYATIKSIPNIIHET